MPGLRLFPNGYSLPGNSIAQLITYENPAFNDKPPESVTGVLWSDIIVFYVTRPAMFHLMLHWPFIFARGVKRTRLENGEVMLTAQNPATMTRLCWDVRDHRTGALLQETATGLVTLQAVVRPPEEGHTLTLHRGDFYQPRTGERVYAERSCGGSGTVGN